MKARYLVVASAMMSSSAIAQEAPSAPPVPEQSRAPEPAQSISQEEHYARDYGVSVSEARRRMDVMRNALQVAADLRRANPETFGGTEIVHGPEFRVLVKFTEDAEARISGLGLSREFEARNVAESERQLAARQAAVVGP